VQVAKVLAWLPVSTLKSRDFELVDPEKLGMVWGVVKGLLFFSTAS
jgi:hypothetical protein